MKRYTIAVCFWITSTCPTMRLVAQPPVAPDDQQTTDAIGALDDFFGPSRPSASTDSSPTTAATTEMHTSDPNRHESLESIDRDVTGMKEWFGKDSDSDTKAGENSKVDGRRGRGERIEPAGGFRPGRQLALLEQRPLLVLFGAKWCNWCRQLEEELLGDEATPILRVWVVTHVDVDREPNVAYDFDINTLPSMCIVDAAGEVVASRTGYLPIPELEAWLDENVQNADPVLQGVLFDTNSPTSEEIDQLVELLSQRSVPIRTAAGRRLTAHRTATAGAVVDTFRTGNLSAQLSALSILENWNAPTKGLDPWQPDSINSKSTSALIDWLRASVDNEVRDHESGNNREHEQGDDGQVGADTDQANQVLLELINAPQVRVAELFERAVAIGDAVVVETRRIESTDDSLDDEQRRLLRRVRYSALAGHTLRLEYAGLIRSLAELDVASHRAAAENLLTMVTSQDQPLVVELSTDRDPLVREHSVEAFHRIGALTDDDHLQRLLNDEGPNVRTAVLRQLAENPSEDVTARLIEYLDSETDEDLLIYATKTLGMLAESEDACVALAELIDHKKWRVRAAALDAVSEFLDNGTYGWPYDNMQSTVNEAIADAVLDHTEDEDPFVAEKAQFLLPKVISKRTAGVVARFLLDDDERAQRIIASVDQYEMDHRMGPIVELSKSWLDSSDPQQLADAAMLMTRIAPTILRYRLDDLLGSEERAVRMAALQALIPGLTDLRSKGIEEDLNGWRLAMEPSASRRLLEVPLIRAIPDAFQPFEATSDAWAADENRSDESAEKIAIDETSITDDPLDSVSSFFGSSATHGDEKGTASQTAADSEVLSENSEPSSLDLASLFFGDPAVGNEGTTNTTEPLASNLDLNRIGLGSYWMERWQSDGKDAMTRPTWVRECVPVLRQLLESDDPSERQWAQTALLACGETGVLVEGMLVSASDDSYRTREKQLVSWLPEAKRHQWVRDHLSILETDEANSADAEIWRQALSLDLFGAAATINEQLKHAPNLSAEKLSMYAASIRYACFGADNDFSFVSGDQIELEPSQPLADRKTIALFPNQMMVVEWLVGQYRLAESDQQKAVMLSLLNHASRRHGIAEALCVLDDAEEDSMLVGVAMGIAFSDVGMLAADRAIILLSHPVQRVADESLRRLVRKDYRFEGSESGLGLDPVYSYDEGLYPLQQSQRPLPTEVLQRIQNSPKEPNASFASALLLSQGESIDPDRLLERLSDLDSALTLVTICLAKAGRIDDDAISIYERCIKSLDPYESEAVQMELTRLKDDRIKQLLKQLSQSSDGFAW